MRSGVGIFMAAGWTGITRIGDRFCRVAYDGTNRFMPRETLIFMFSIFRKPNLMATLLAVVLMSAVNYYHNAPNPLVSALIAGLVFFALFSVLLAWVNQTPKE